METSLSDGGFGRGLDHVEYGGRLVGLEFDFHPIQIFDFLGGVLFIDFAHDDLATTRRLRFNAVESQLIRSLNEAQQGRAWGGENLDEAAQTDAGEEPGD